MEYFKHHEMPTKFDYEEFEFHFFNNLDDFDENKFSLFNGICYAYSDKPELLVEMVNEGKIDKKKLFKNCRDNYYHGDIMVYEVVNGRCVDYKLFSKNDNICYKNIYYLKEHHINNEKGLVVELNKYKFQIFKSKKDVCGLFYFKSSHNNFHVPKGARSSFLNGIQKTWSTIGWGFDDFKKYGYYLSSEINYKNGKKHGLSLEWKNDENFVSLSEKNKKYSYKPKLVFCGDFYKGVEIGTHFFWSYNKENQVWRNSSSYIKERGIDNYTDSIYYLEKKINYYPIYYRYSFSEELGHSLVYGLNFDLSSDFPIEYELKLDFKEADLKDDGSFSKTPLNNSKVRTIWNWKKTYWDLDRKKIKKEEIFDDIWDLNQRPIETNEYWKNGNLKKIIKNDSTKCFNKKGERVQCND